jgi:hypothetical protein
MKVRNLALPFALRRVSFSFAVSAESSAICGTAPSEYF